MPSVQPVATGQAKSAKRVGDDEGPSVSAVAREQRQEEMRCDDDPGSTSVSWLAWTVVAMAFFSDALAMGGRSFFAVVLPLWEVEFDWSRSHVSSAMSLVHIFQGVGEPHLELCAFCVANTTEALLTPLSFSPATPFAGHLVDVLGPRGGLTAGTLYLAAMLGLTATLRHSWHLFVIFGVGLGIGFGLLNLNVYSAMIMQIVPKSRAGSAVGIATSGSTFGQFVLVPLFQHLAATHGWRTGYVIAAIATAMVAPVAWTLLSIAVRPAPRTDGLESGAAEAARLEGGSSRTTPQADNDTLKRKLMRLATNRLYWALTFAFIICGVTTTGFMESHIVAVAEHQGMTAKHGAFAFGLLSAFNGMGILGAGALADRYHRVYLLASIFFVRALCYAALFVVTKYWQLLLFGACFGLVDYSVVPLVVSLVASYCGEDVVGLGVGVLLLWHSIGAAGGSWMGGVVFDSAGHYDHAIWICLAACLAAAIVLVLGGRGVDEPWRRNSQSSPTNDEQEDSRP